MSGRALQYLGSVFFVFQAQCIVLFDHLLGKGSDKKLKLQKSLKQLPKPAQKYEDSGIMAEAFNYFTQKEPAHFCASSF